MGFHRLHHPECTHVCGSSLGEAPPFFNTLTKPIPSTSYLPRPALDPDGYVKISPSLHFPSTYPNHLHHFAVGDITAWSGIKRCGAAMHMGHLAAENVYQQILCYRKRPSPSPSSMSSGSSDVSDSPDSTSEQDPKPQFKTLSEHPPMIGLALGKTAISYSPTEGTKHGEDVMEKMFGTDLGWSICWNYMQLGREPEKERRSNLEKVQGAGNIADVEGQNREWGSR